jgi:glycosyltransferase involved in cell wall biosynthesis
LLFDAYLLLREIVSPLKLRLLIVGDGSLSPQILALRERSALDTEEIIVTGWTDTPYSWWQAIDVFVLTSAFEGMPQALLEAIQWRKRIVSVPWAGIDDITRIAPWIRVSPERSREAVADTISSALWDAPPSEVRMLAAAAYFSAARMATDTSRVYQRC